MCSDIYVHKDGEAYYFTDWENPDEMESWYMIPG